MNREMFRIEGEIKKFGEIQRIPLNRKLLWQFVKLYLRTVFKKEKFIIWSLEYSTKDSYCIIIQKECK